jgi:hypothetical protein
MDLTTSHTRRVPSMLAGGMSQGTDQLRSKGTNDKEKKRERAPGPLVLKPEKWREKGRNHFETGGGVIGTGI